MISVTLTAQDRKRLASIRQSPSDERAEKALAVLLSDEGCSVPAISDRIKRHHHTVRSWLKRFNTEGVDGLTRKRSSGRPSIRKISIQPFIETVIDEDPEHHGYKRNCWTLEMLRIEYEKKTGNKTSVDSIKRSLKDLGYSFKKAKATKPETSPSKEEKVSRIHEMVSEILKLSESVKGNQIDVFSVDETHFSTQPYLPRGWFKKRTPHSCPYSEE